MASFRWIMDSFSRTTQFACNSNRFTIHSATLFWELSCFCRVKSKIQCSLANMPYSFAFGRKKCERLKSLFFPKNLRLENSQIFKSYMKTYINAITLLSIFNQFIENSRIQKKLCELTNKNVKFW